MSLTRGPRGPLPVRDSQCLGLIFIFCALSLLGLCPGVCYLLLKCILPFTHCHLLTPGMFLTEPTFISTRSFPPLPSVLTLSICTHTSGQILSGTPADRTHGPTPAPGAHTHTHMLTLAYVLTLLTFSKNRWKIMLPGVPASLI